MDRYIDFDTHVYEPIETWVTYMDPKFRDRAPQWVKGPEGQQYLNMAGEIFPKVPKHPGFVNTYGPDSKMDRSGNDPHVRLKRMDEEHTQIHVIYPTLGMMGFATSVADPKLALAQAQAYNRYMGEFCSADPKRLIGAALAPFNHPEVAAQEMRRAHKEHGFKVVYTQPTPPGDIPWSDPSRDPIWRTAEELGLTIVFHESTPGAPVNAVGIHRFTSNWPLIYLATHTVEVQFAFADLILGGTLERFPKLKIGAAESHIHWVPGWLALMDQNFGAATNIFKNASGEFKLSLKPSDYFRRNCFVAAFPEDTMIKEALDYAPESIVVISDWPHPIAAEHSEGGLDMIANHKGLTQKEKQALLIDNPLRFL